MISSFDSSINFTSLSKNHTIFFGYVLKLSVPGGINLTKEVKPKFNSNLEAVTSAFSVLNDLRKTLSATPLPEDLLEKDFVLVNP